MTKSPMLWGAGLACVLGGAVAGNALGSTPIHDRSTISVLYQTHETAEPAPPREELPDHYPLVTREGTVPVAALSNRGLYSQRRYNALYYVADIGPGDMPHSYEPDQPAWEPTEPDPPASYAEEDAGTPALEDEGAVPTPLQLAAGPAAVEPAGRAKTIDVAAQLALR